MPMQYRGGNKVNGFPKSVRTAQGIPMPGGNTQIGKGGTARAAAAPGEGRIGGYSGSGSARIGQGGYGLKPGLVPKKKQPFNSARQKGLAVALRARNARGIPMPGAGSPGGSVDPGGNVSEY